MPINYKKYCLILIVMIHTVYQTSAQEVLTKVNSGASWQPHPNNDGNGIYSGSGELTASTTVVRQKGNDLSFSSSGGQMRIDDFTLVINQHAVGVGTSNPQSSLHVNGSLSYATRIVTVGGTGIINVNENNHLIFVNTQAVDANINLPDPTTCEGRIYRFIKTRTNNSLIFNRNIRITPTSSSITFSGTNVKLTIISDGTEWQKLKI